MVFKAVSGNQLAVGKDFLGAGNINKDEPKARDLDTALVFRDGDILDNWDQLVIEKVLPIAQYEFICTILHVVICFVSGCVTVVLYSRLSMHL